MSSAVVVTGALRVKYQQSSSFLPEWSPWEFFFSTMHLYKNIFWAPDKRGNTDNSEVFFFFLNQKNVVTPR